MKNESIFFSKKKKKKNKTEKQVFQTLKREHQLGELSFKS